MAKSKSGDLGAVKSTVRDLAIKRGDIFTLTGPLYDWNSPNLDALKGRVLIPTAMFKLVLDPSRQECTAYVSKNEDTSDYEVVALSELNKRAGMILLPTGGCSRQMVLPVPTSKHAARKNRGGDDYREAGAAPGDLGKAVRMLQGVLRRSL